MTISERDPEDFCGRSETHRETGSSVPHLENAVHCRLHAGPYGRQTARTSRSRRTRHVGPEGVLVSGGISRLVHLVRLSGAIAGDGRVPE